METEASIQALSLAQYLTQEEHAKEKHNYINGNLLKVPGGTSVHNLIAARILIELGYVLDKKDKAYYIFNSDMKIHIPEFNHVVYPDAVVVCEKIELYPGRQDILVNPLLVIEVLSTSTSMYDRTTKFWGYKSIPAFKEYILIYQDQPWIESFHRIKTDQWENEVVKGLDSHLNCRSIDCEISLNGIYRGVTFPT